MADQQIEDLTELTDGNLVDADEFIVNDVSDTGNDAGGEPKRILASSIATYIGAGTAISNVVEDTTPQLGGSLDVNGQKIVSVSNADIDIEPNGTGNVLLGNYTFDADQTVGAGQDNYVLTYDDGTGLISLEAAAGGGGTPGGSDTQVQYNNAGAFGGISQLTYDGSDLALLGASLSITETDTGAIPLSVTSAASPAANIVTVNDGANDRFFIDSSGDVNVQQSGAAPYLFVERTDGTGKWMRFGAGLSGVSLKFDNTGTFAFGPSSSKADTGASTAFVINSNGRVDMPDVSEALMQFHTSDAKIRFTTTTGSAGIQAPGGYGAFTFTTAANTQIGNRNANGTVTIETNIAAGGGGASTVATFSRSGTAACALTTDQTADNVLTVTSATNPTATTLLVNAAGTPTGSIAELQKGGSTVVELGSSNFAIDVNDDIADGGISIGVDDWYHARNAAGTSGRVFGVSDQTGVFSIGDVDNIGAGANVNFWQQGAQILSLSNADTVTIDEDLDVKGDNPQLSVVETGASDPVFRMELNGGQQYILRLDNSDSDSLRLGAGAGDGTLIWKADSSGNLTIGQTTTVQGDINPNADGTLDLGTQTTAQWANVWSDLVNGAEISLENRWRIMESELYIGYPQGFAIGHSEQWETGKSIYHADDDNKRRYMSGQSPTFAVTDDWIEFRGRRITVELLDKLLALAE